MDELIWQCLGCGAVYSSESAKRECELEDQEANRSASQLVPVS